MSLQLTKVITMANASYGDQAISEVLDRPLEKWPNQDGRFLIHLEHPEFSGLCPRSGYPDSGCIVLDYIPGDWVVELKDFKLYINSFRSQRISHERVVNVIADRLFKELEPHAMRVIGDFMRRGGVKTVITVERGQGHTFASYTPQVL
jgi:7-cyano-7-deazaguanine reductase